MVSPSAKRAAFNVLRKRDYSVRLSSKTVGLSRNAAKRQREEPRPQIRDKIILLALENPSYGYRRICALMHGVNHKAVHRVWKDEGLSQRVRKVRKVVATKRPGAPLSKPNEVWAIDFCADRLENNRPMRILAVLDGYTRYGLTLKSSPSFRACDLVDELKWLFLVNGKPQAVRTDNGPEFRSNRVKTFLEEEGVAHQFIEPGSPWQNGHVESFFGKLRCEVLSREIFLTRQDLQATLEEALEHYNCHRPHSALGYLTPSQFAAGYEDSGRARPSRQLHNRINHTNKEDEYSHS